MVRQCVAHVTETFSTSRNQSTDKVSSVQQYHIIHRVTLETVGHREEGQMGLNTQAGEQGQLDA